MRKRQGGFIYLVILLVVSVATLGTFILAKNPQTQNFIGKFLFSNQKPSQQNSEEVSQSESIAPEDTGSEKLSGLPSSKPSQKPTFKPTLKPTAKLVSKVTPSPTQIPIATNQTRCEVAISSTFVNEPLRINFAASLYYGKQYVTGAQWDFDGDGNWDTDLSLSNSTKSYTFPRSGSYNVRLQIKMSEGGMTDVCTKTVTVPVADQSVANVSVRLNGQAYRDINCSNSQDSGEEGVSGVAVNLFKLPEYYIYQTLTTDSNGNYNFSGIIGANDVLSLEVSYVAATGYKISPSFGYLVRNLNKTSSSQTANLPLVPNESVGLCAL